MAMGERLARRMYKLREVGKQNPFFKSKNISPEELPTQKVLAVLRQHGPLKTSECWEHAEKAGIKSKTHMKHLLHWLEGKFLAYSKCFHAPVKARIKGKGRYADDRQFKWVAVPPPPEKLPVLCPEPPVPRLYTRRRYQFRLKKLKRKLGDEYLRPGKLKKKRLAAGIVYKPFKYGDPKLIKAAKTYPERRAIILAAVATRTAYEAAMKRAG